MRNLLFLALFLVAGCSASSTQSRVFDAAAARQESARNADRLVEDTRGFFLSRAYRQIDTACKTGSYMTRLFTGNTHIDDVAYTIQALKKVGFEVSLNDSYMYISWSK